MQDTSSSAATAPPKPGPLARLATRITDAVSGFPQP